LYSPTVVGRALLDEGVDLAGQLRFGQPPEHRQDGAGLQPHRHGGVERVRREDVLVHVGGAAHGLGHGDKEVVRGFVHGREGLEEDAPVAADPQRAVRVVGLQDQVAVVVVAEAVAALPLGLDGTLHSR
jgi:hypothetical protein